jgi:hypothetical protein
MAMRGPLCGERKASKRMNKTGVGDDDPTVMESEEMEL